MPENTGYTPITPKWELTGPGGRTIPAFEWPEYDELRAATPDEIGAPE